MTTSTTSEPTASEVMTTLLLSIEAGFHGGGWDQTPPQLVALRGPGTDPRAWKVVPLTDDRMWLGRAPETVLRLFANFLVDPALPRAMAWSRDQMIDQLARGPLRAVVMICETWLLECALEERRQHRSLGDHPNAKEARCVFAMAPDSTVYTVFRLRGEEPFVVWSNPETGDHGNTGGVSYDGFGEFSGAIARSLRRIVNVVNARSGLPLIKHVRDTCNRCGASLQTPDDGVLPAPECPACHGTPNETPNEAPR